MTKIDPSAGAADGCHQGRRSDRPHISGDTGMTRADNHSPALPTEGPPSVVGRSLGRASIADKVAFALT